MSEPNVIKAGLRDACDNDGFEELHIECRFSDGQKHAAIVVDAEFPSLAYSIVKFLNEQSNTSKASDK